MITAHTGVGNNIMPVEGLARGIIGYRMKQKTIVTEIELNKAIQKFLEEGGMIKKLPEQKAYSSRQVGVKYGAADLSVEAVG